MSINVQLNLFALANKISLADKIFDIFTDDEANTQLGTSYVNFEHPYIIDLSWKGKGYWLMFRGHNADESFDVYVVEIDPDSLIPKWDTVKRIYTGISFAHPAPVPFVDPYNEQIKMIWSPAAGQYQVDVFDLDFNLVSQGTSQSFPNTSDVVAGFAPLSQNVHFMLSFPNASRHYLRLHKVDDSVSILATRTVAKLRTTWLIEHSYIYASGLYVIGMHELAPTTDGAQIPKYVPAITWTPRSSTTTEYRAVMAILNLPFKYWMPADWLHVGIQFTKRPWLVFCESLGWPWGRKNFRMRAIPITMDILNPDIYRMFVVFADNNDDTFTSRNYVIQLPTDVRLAEIWIGLSETGDISVTGGSEGEVLGSETIYSASSVTGNHYIKYENPPRLIRISITYSTAAGANVIVWLRK